MRTRSERIRLATGARKNNVLSMRWQDVDLENGTWIIPDTKNGTGQTIMLTPDELKLLKQRFNDRKSLEWVFPGRVRGSAFYLNPERALEDLWKTLDQMKIYPNTEGSCSTSRSIEKTLETEITNR